METVGTQIDIVIDGSPEKEEESEFYNRLVSEGPLSNGDHGVAPKDIDFSWVNPDLIKEGQDYFRRNLTPCGLSGVLGLFMVFSIPRVTGLLLQSGYFHIKETVGTRYLGLVYHIQLWLQSDLFQRVSKGSQDAYATRKVHTAAGRAFNPNLPLPDLAPLSERSQRLLAAVRADLEPLDDSSMPDKDGLLSNYHPTNPMSQFDMAIVLFVFYGLHSQFPAELGAGPSAETQGFEGYVHLWAVIGKLLGLEDRFNPALHYKDRGAQRRVMKDIILARFKHIDRYAMTILETTFGAGGAVFPLLRTPVALTYLVDRIALKKSSVKGTTYGTMTKWERFSYKFFCFLSWQMAGSSLVRLLVNYGARVLLWVLTTVYLRRMRNQPSLHQRKSASTV